MSPTRIILALFLTILAGTSLACGSSDDADPEPATVRCDTCGMVVVADDGWRAGADDVSFDSPKCLFRHANRHGSLTSPWVIEYYSQERRDAETLLYVTGTDLESPMGIDLVPVEGREAAERLQTDHGGDEILAFNEVDAELIETLFQ